MNNASIAVGAWHFCTNRECSQATVLVFVGKQVVEQFTFVVFGSTAYRIGPSGTIHLNTMKNQDNIIYRYKAYVCRYSYLVSSSSGVKIDTTLSSWNSPNRKSVDGVPEVMLHDEAAELIPLSVFWR